MFRFVKSSTKMPNEGYTQLSESNHIISSTRQIFGEMPANSGSQNSHTIPAQDQHSDVFKALQVSLQHIVDPQYPTKNRASELSKLQDAFDAKGTLPVKEHFELLHNMIEAMKNCDNKINGKLNSILQAQLARSNLYVHEFAPIPDDATVNAVEEEKTLHLELQKSINTTIQASNAPVSINGINTNLTNIEKIVKSLRMNEERHKANWRKAAAKEAAFGFLRHYIRDGASATKTSRNIDRDSHFENASLIQCLIEGAEKYIKEHGRTSHVPVSVWSRSDTHYSPEQKVRLIPDLLEGASKMNNKAHVSKGMLAAPILLPLSTPFLALGAFYGENLLDSDMRRTIKKSYCPRKNQGMLLKLAIRQFDQIEHITDEEKKKAAIKEMFEGLTTFAKNNRDAVKSSWANELMMIATYKTPSIMAICVAENPELRKLQNDLRQVLREK